MRVQLEQEQLKLQRMREGGPDATVGNFHNVVLLPALATGPGKARLVGPIDGTATPVSTPAPPAAAKYALSPRVEGINRQPTRVTHAYLAGHQIGLTAIIGGLFHVLPAAMYREFYLQGGYDETLPLAKGQDDQLCEWLRMNGYRKGYIEDVVVEHYEGTDAQARRFPEYFERKFREEMQA
jgi:hypothetical protein